MQEIMPMMNSMFSPSISPHNIITSLKESKEKLKDPKPIKYLDGELGNDVLHAILRTLDADKPVGKNGFSLPINPLFRLLN